MAMCCYDEKVDILYVSFAEGEKATAAVELNDNILLRFNRAEKRAIGLTLMDFSVLIQLTQLGPRHFRLSGLQDLEPDWQELVIAMITRPPVSDILKVSSFVSSPLEIVPITSVAKPPLLMAA
ncbi:MAG: DUF2283 domain-containing protein [Caldilineales bacterium]|nr:DUF2283 domain-containing protein [Caldilineales bacterium]MCW5861154.1 DUF2283 domain-containing protein [Caldilineales bacterium]